MIIFVRISLAYTAVEHRIKTLLYVSFFFFSMRHSDMPRLHCRDLEEKHFHLEEKRINISPMIVVSYRHRFIHLNVFSFKIVLHMHSRYPNLLLFHASPEADMNQLSFFFSFPVESAFSGLAVPAFPLRPQSPWPLHLVFAGINFCVTRAGAWS